jgi:hypothetical protein
MHRQRGASRARRAAWLIPVLVAVVSSASCASFNEPYSVDVKNDLRQTVTLAVCDSADCSTLVDRWVLGPGQVGAVNVEINAGYGPAIVHDSHGAIIGCLPFRMAARPQMDVSVRVTQAVPCGSSGGTAATLGKDWPDARY